MRGYIFSKRQRGSLQDRVSKKSHRLFSTKCVKWKSDVYMKEKNVNLHGKIIKKKKLDCVNFSKYPSTPPFQLCHLSRDIPPFQQMMLLWML